MDINEIRRLLNDFLVESEDLFWKNWVGLLDEIDMESLVEKYEPIFSLETIETALKVQNDTVDPDLKIRSRALTGQLILSYMEYQARSFQQEILKKEAASQVNWEGQSFPIRGFAIKIINEPDRNKRREMIDAREKVVNSELNPIRIQYVENLFETVRRLGYQDYIHLCSEIQNRDFHGFAGQMESFLTESEPVFQKHLAAYLKSEAGLDDIGDAHEADLTAVFRCPRFDPHFPADMLLDCVRRTIAPMGFSFSRIKLDLENRPKKKPRACVSAVNPPDDVRLTIFPAGGYDDYAGFLHETGHAVHFTHERPNLDFEFKFWGDRGFTEGTAYLFQHITMNHIWLSEMIRMEDPTEFMKFNAYMNNHRFRRLIAQFLFQMDLFKSRSVEGMEKRYAGLMSRAHGVRFESSGYLNFDLELYSAGYLRARMFEQQLRIYIENSIGPGWWKQNETSRLLTGFYTEGRKSRADDAVRRLGYKDLDYRMYLKQQQDVLA